MGEPQFRGFDNKAIRSAFVSKVYSILSVQLIATSIIIGSFVLHEPTKQYFQSPAGLIWTYVALGVGLVVYLILVCIETTRRSFPLNFILLSLLTAAYALLAATLAAQYDTKSVLFAFGTTAFATFAITLIAKYSPLDITTCGCALCILALLHLIASIIIIIFVKVELANLIIASLGALLVSLYLMFDLQLIMGGRSIELSPEEYILAAIMLYIDIVYLFQYMLILVGNRSN